MNIISWFRSVWGESPGYVFFPTITKGKWRENRAFLWPKEESAIAAHLTAHYGDDQYFSVLKYSAMQRSKQHAMPGNLLFADMDEARIDTIPDDLFPTHLWKTSDNRHSAIWKTSRQTLMSFESGGVNSRLTAFLGADPSGWDMTQVLRVPGTMNNKYAPAQKGAIVRHDPERTVAKDIFTMLPAKPMKPLTGNAKPRAYSALCEALDPLSVWLTFKPKVSMLTIKYMESREPGPNDDRSQVLWSIMRDLAKAGAHYDDIVLLTSTCPYNKHGMDSKGLDRIEKDVKRALALTIYEFLNPTKA